MRKVLLKLSCLLITVLALLTSTVKAESIPTITKQPLDVSAYYNSTFTLSIETTGTNIHISGK